MNQSAALVITPVKDSIETTISTARSIATSDIKVSHVIFDDFSNEDTVAQLKKYQAELGYALIHLRDLTDHPSPNYKLVLEMAQQRALDQQLPLIIVESDVIVKENTFSALLNTLHENPNAGLIGAITVDQNGEVNFPYLKFKGVEGRVVKTKRSLSFCCTLISNRFLQSFDFTTLDQNKNWYDVFISHQASSLGFENIVLMDTTVFHQPHGSRPWKALKYKNPIKYYFLKFCKGLDKI